MKVEQKNFAILTVLALIGVGMAFALTEFMVGGELRSEDAWIYQKPVPVEKLPTLTEDQRQGAIEIAKQNDTVRQYLDLGYEMLGISPIFGNIPKGETEIADMYMSLRKDKEWIFVNVDMNEEKVTGILKSHGEIAISDTQEGEIKAVNETEIRIAIGGKEGKLIRAPEVRELTEKEKKKAREIALTNPEVQNIIKGKNYEMEIKSMGVIITNETGELETKFDGASVMFELEDRTIYFVHVDLEKEKVIRISPQVPSPMPPINK